MGQLKRFENRDITGEGIVEASIPPNAISAYLRVELPEATAEAAAEEEEEEDEGEGDAGGEREEEKEYLEYSFRLGRLEPSDTPRGARQRLVNLGLLPPGGESSGAIDPPTAAALRAFQIQAGLRPTGELDASTATKLAEIHDHE